MVRRDLLQFAGNFLYWMGWPPPRAATITPKTLSLINSYNICAEARSQQAISRRRRAAVLHIPQDRHARFKDASSCLKMQCRRNAER